MQRGMMPPVLRPAVPPPQPLHSTQLRRCHPSPPPGAAVHAPTKARQRRSTSSSAPARAMLLLARSLQS
eukprot:5636447-Prymnesium_polylepis.1